MTGADAFCIATLSEGRILEINDRFVETYGHSRDEALGGTALELGLYLDPSDRERLVTAIRTEGQVRNMEEKRRKKNGEVINILISANLLQGSGEDIILSASRDITEQRRAEAALLRVRQAVDASGEVVFMTDAEGIFTFVNPEFTRLYGYAEGEVVGKLTPRMLDSGLAPPEKIEAFWRSLRQKRVARGEIVNRARDGRLLTMHTSVSPILSETGETLGYMTIQRDITERKKTQQELERSFGQLRALAVRLQGVREEERKRLARELHDQLGQALTAIKLDVCALVREMGADHQAPLPRVSTILKLVDETTECVRRIATELRPGVLDDLGLMAAIEWAGGDFEARTGTKCRLVLPSDEIRVDSERATAIFRILQEALTNVVRHAAASEVEVRLETKENELILLVHDNGKGMDEGKISRGESLGILGMKERARLFGGQVMIYGACGTGTTVRVRIPTQDRRIEEPL
jgi:PAS domain S-box-containing protein